MILSLLYSLNIVLILNLKLILAPLAIKVSFKAAPVSWLLTET